VFDEAEILADPPAPRWPLHPQPMRFEHLDTFVRRLADAYGVGLGTFCRYGLGITGEEWANFCADPPLPVLARLSAGSGLSVRRLQNMTPRRSYARLLIAMRRLCREHPEALPAWVTRTSQQTPV
jgi:hypothetical protein